jgi:hypothetical protein
LYYADLQSGRFARCADVRISNWQQENDSDVQTRHSRGNDRVFRTRKCNSPGSKAEEK